MKKITLFTYCLLLSLNLFAKSDYNSYWTAANKYYEQKNYDSAAFYYEKIAATQPREAVVYFNLGNTYYKLNHIALSVLNYERALAIDPSYTEASDNLSIAQSRIPNRIPQAQDIFFIRWWKAITASNISGFWAVASLLIFLTLIGLNTVKKLRLSSVHIPGQLFATGWAMLVLLLVFAFVSAGRRANPNVAVVTQNDAPFYVSPQQTKPALFVPEGTSLKTGNRLQGWIEVSLPDGRDGWIQLNSITQL